MSLKRLNVKGAFDMSSPFVLAMGVLVLFIAIQLFIPFADLVTNAMSGQTNGAVFGTIIWVIPLLMVGMLIFEFVQDMRSPRI